MRRICILGTGPASRDDAPYDDPSVEMWTIARGMNIPPRVDILFELHVPQLWDGWGDKEASKLYVDLLRECKIPIYMQEKIVEIPQSRVFPKDEILKVVTPYELGCEAPYETSQVSWMISYAMYQLYNPNEISAYWFVKAHGKDAKPIGEILFYGIDLISEGEARSYQRHCLEYYAGMCRGWGIKLTIADKSSLCKQKVKGLHATYGYDYPLNRDEAVWIYGHPMRQIIKDSEGKIHDVREVPGLLGMPMIDMNGKTAIRVVGNVPESMKGLECLKNEN